MSLAMLKRCLPPAARSAAREALRAHALWRAVQRLMAAPAHRTPDRALLADLREAWGNDGYCADLDFLCEVARWAARTPGPVLECGAGLTTILLGTLAARRWVDVWSLEHDRRWHARVAAVLQRHHIPGVHLTLAPLRSYGDFTWYDAPLQAMPARFALVVCDGPPEQTRGGRYGLVPILRDRLKGGSVILLDDAARESEFRALCRWTREAALRVQLHELPAGTFAQIEVTV